MDKELLQFSKCDVFTPSSISKKMVPFLSNKGNLLEPACGVGDLLKHVRLDYYDKVDLYDIKGSYLEKCPTGSNIQTHCLDFLKAPLGERYDNIIMNPPYIRFQDLSVEYRNYIKTMWPLLQSGNIDIYYAFILKCLSLLHDDGIMISITPNSYLYNKCAIPLRKYLVKNCLIQEIIDFKSEKVFDQISTYCCITVFTKRKKAYFIYNQSRVKYADMSNEFYLFPVEKSNPTLQKLGQICSIKNGLATLYNKAYVYDEKRFDEPCWRRLYSPKKLKWIIYPYNNGTIIKEAVFKERNPETYLFLLQYKDRLAERDKGKKAYPEWYAYGRTQSLVISSLKEVLYIPIFQDPTNIKYYVGPPMLFMSCLCIEKKSHTYQQIIDFIENKKYMIVTKSAKRGGGWINLSTRTLKNISIE